MRRRYVCALCLELEPGSGECLSGRCPSNFDKHSFVVSHKPIDIWGNYLLNLKSLKLTK